MGRATSLAQKLGSGSGRKITMRSIGLPIARKKISSARKTRKMISKQKSRVNEAGNYTKPELRKRLFNKIKAGTKGGDPGEFSARKAQLLAREYKKAGGGYRD